MKAYSGLWDKIISKKNLMLAHKHAKKGKGWYEEVQIVNSDIKNGGSMIEDLRLSLINHTYKTSKYRKQKRKEGKKIRDLYKLPYYPDRIGQWAIIQVIEPILIKNLIFDTYSAIPKRGIHRGLKRIKQAMYHDVKGCQYCLKIDAAHYYQSINHEILKDKFRRVFKDPDLLWVVDQIIDSICTATDEDLERLSQLKPINRIVLTMFIRGRKESQEEREQRYLNSGVGLPIGNYFSQYGGNFYFSDFDHYVKEELHVKHYYRYMDDIVFLAETKEQLWTILEQIDDYFQTRLRITIKDNYQIFPSYVRGVDFLGFRVFHNFTLLRKSTCLGYKKRVIRIRKKLDAGISMSYSDFCSLNSYKGWLKSCDSERLQMKYGYALEHEKRLYKLKNIKRCVK